MNINLAALTISLILLSGGSFPIQAQSEEETCKKLRQLDGKTLDEVRKNNTNYEKIKKNYEEMLQVAGATNNRSKGCIVEYKATALRYFKRYTEAYEMLVDWFGMDIDKETHPGLNSGLYSLTAESAKEAAKLDLTAGNYDAALRKLNNGVRATVPYDSARKQLYEVYGDVWVAKGDLRRAVEYYKKAEKPEKSAQAEKQFADKFANDTQAVKADGTPDYERRMNALVAKKRELFDAKKYSEIIPLMDEIIKLNQTNSNTKDIPSNYDERGSYFSLIALRDNSQSAANSCIADTLKSHSLGWKASYQSSLRLSQCDRVAGHYQRSYDELTASVEAFNSWAKTERHKKDFEGYREKFSHEISEAYIELFDQADSAMIKLTRNQYLESIIQMGKKGFCERITGTWKRKDIQERKGERGTLYRLTSNDEIVIRCGEDGKVSGNLSRQSKFWIYKPAEIYGKEVNGSLYLNFDSRLLSKNRFFHDGQFSFFFVKEGMKVVVPESTEYGDTFKVTASIGPAVGLKHEYKKCSLTSSVKDGKAVLSFQCDDNDIVFYKQ